MMLKFILIAIFQVLLCRCKKNYDFDINGNPIVGYSMISNIGTPPQRISLLVDTASSNLAVPVVNLKIFNTGYFVYNESLTFSQINEVVKLRYVQGYWTGFLGLDVFNLCLEQDCAIICNISCMSSMEEDVFCGTGNPENQGVIGLAYSSIAVPDSSARPFLDIFFEQKNISNIFSLYLCGPFHSSKDQFSSCGKLHVGHYSQNLIRGDIRYTPISHEWLYEITIVDVKVGGRHIPIKCEHFNENASNIDSGATRLNLPISIYSWVIVTIKDYVANSIPNNFWFDETSVCMKNNKPLNIALFPLLSLSLYHSKNEFFNLHISPELYLLPTFNNSCAELAIGTSKYGIQIGSSILRGFYVIFDRENKKIGFANTRFQNVKYVGKVSDIKTCSRNFDNCIRKTCCNDSFFSTDLLFFLWSTIPIFIIGTNAVLKFTNFRQFFSWQGFKSRARSIFSTTPKNQ